MGARALLAAERRDGAEAADAVAPLGDLHVGPRGTGGGPRELEQVEAAGRRAAAAAVRVARVPRGRPPCRGVVGDELVAEAGHEVDLGEGVAQLVAVALGHAAGDDEAGAGAAALGQHQDGVDRLLAGGLDEGARVDDDEVGAVGVSSALVALCLEVPLELVGVDLVLGTSQGLHVSRDPRLRTRSSLQAGSRRGDGARRARRERAHVPDARHGARRPSGEGGI